MKLIFGYDIITPYGPLPNCLNPKFYQTVYDASNLNYDKCRDYFIEKWECDYSVFNSHDYDNISEKKSLNQIIKDSSNGEKYDWFYIVEPHSGLDLFFGEHHVHNTFLLNFMSDVAISEIKNGNGNLLINYIIDGGLGMTTKNFQKIIDFTKKHNIPDNKVFLIFSDFKLKDNLIKLGVNYNVYDYNFYLKFKSHEFNNIIRGGTNMTMVTQNDFLDSINNNKKDFLLLTRHWKLHRILLLSQLHKLGLENNLVSWEKSYYNHLYIEKLLEYDDNKEFADLVTNTSKYIDVEDLTKIKGIEYENKKMYLDTYISIVTESIFFTEMDSNLDVNFPTGFLSEKIWKPIGHCQPFILAGPSFSLKYIKERYGFKTFHPYIDETYDTEDDNFKRLKLIQKEIEKFSAKSTDEKIKFLNDVKDICIFNQNKFLEIGRDTFGELPIDEELTKVRDFLLN